MEIVRTSGLEQVLRRWKIGIGVILTPSKIQRTSLIFNIENCPLNLAIISELNGSWYSSSRVLMTIFHQILEILSKVNLREVSKLAISY